MCVFECAERSGIPIPEPLRSDHLATAAHQARLSAETAEIAARFRDSGIEWLLFKGQAIQLRYYAGKVRESGDLDIVVDPKRLGEAREVLRSMGFVSLSDRDTTPGFPLELCRRGLVVDLHDTLVETHIATLPCHADLWERRVELRKDQWTLSDTDYLLALLVHGFKHHWSRLRWVLDVALCLRTVDAEVIDEALCRARSLAIERIALSGVALADSLFPSASSIGGASASTLLSA